jgi:hypothetical protein
VAKERAKKAEADDPAEERANPDLLCKSSAEGPTSAKRKNQSSKRDLGTLERITHLAMGMLEKMSAIARAMEAALKANAYSMEIMVKNIAKA